MPSASVEANCRISASSITLECEHTLFPSSNSVEPQRGTASSSVLQCGNNSFSLQSQRGMSLSSNSLEFESEMFIFFCQLNKNMIYLCLYSRSTTWYSFIFSFTMW